MRSDGLLSEPNSRSDSKPNSLEAVLVQTGARRSPVCNMLLSATGDLVGGVADFSALDTLRTTEVIDSYPLAASITSYFYLGSSILNSLLGFVDYL